MLRQKRLLKEFLEEKKLEKINSEKTERMKKLKELYENNLSLPHELREDACELLNEMIYHIDIGESHQIPRVAVTTSRDPSSMLKRFAKTISLLFNGRVFSRGSMTLEGLSTLVFEEGITALFVLSECKGRPSGMSIYFGQRGPNYHLNILKCKFENRRKSFSPNVGLITDGFSTNEGLKFKTFISLLFPSSSNYKRVVLIHNDKNTITLKHYQIEKEITEDELMLEVSVYKITSGPVEHNIVEWERCNYLNSTCKPIF